MANADEKKQQKVKTDSVANAGQAGQASQANNNAVEIDLVALFYRLLEKFHWILLTALVGAGIALVIVSKFVTPMYQATAKIYIVGSDTTISLSDLQIGSNLAADYQEVFKNWHVHELVDNRLNLNYSYTKLAGMISVTNPSNTHVLYVSAKSPDPVEAKTLADAYAQVAREFIATKMDMREPNIFEEARMPSAPVSPQKTRDIIIGFLLGGLLAAAIVTIKFLSVVRILSGEDIEKVGGLATLGIIPLQDIGDEAENSKKGRKKKNKDSNKGGKE